MKLKCNFEIRENRLAALVKSAKEEWISKEILKLDPDFQKFNEELRCSYLILFAAIGLFENGFDEEKTLKILKDILETREPSIPAPGNNLIH